MNERRITGGILVLLGALALLEARRLSVLREEMVAGAVAGDDTFPWIIGALLFLLGLYTIFVARWPVRHIVFPAGPERRQLVTSAGALLAYYLVTPYLGYTFSTLVVSTGLYRAIGGYRWPVALFIGVLTTGALFLVFKVWLAEPLPTGWIGI
ncbi:MAG: tripartite tricarboxylate transporter TctB family protein [Solimonas sp.]